MKRFTFILVVGLVAASACKKTTIEGDDIDGTGKEEQIVDGTGKGGQVVDLSAGSQTSLFLLDNHTLWGSGSNIGGQLGNVVLSKKAGLVMHDVKAMASGHDYSVVVKTDGTLWVLGSGFPNRRDHGTSNQLIQIMEDVDQVWTPSGYNSHRDPSIFALKGHTLWAIGDNTLGKLGIGSNIVAHTIPVKVADDVKMVSPAEYHTLVVKNDHTLWAAGSTFYGALGNGIDVLDGSPPAKSLVKIMDNVKKAAAGKTFSIILSNNGDLWRTGSHYDGGLNLNELGAGGAIEKIPTKMMTGVKDVVAGPYHAMILKQDGSLWAVGWNGKGQLGDGTYIYKNSTPVEVMKDVKLVAAGDDHTLVIKTDGTVWSTGSNILGQLGVDRDKDEFEVSLSFVEVRQTWAEE